MKIKFHRTFSYQATPTKVITHERGTTGEVPDHIGRAALQQRAGVEVSTRTGPGKKANKKKKPTGAPENKGGRPGENKTGVGKKAKRSRRTGSKS